MSFQGVIQNKVKGGLVSEGTSERTVVLICGMSPSSGVKLLEPIELYDSNVASSLGITEDTDLTKKELTAYHISEMFRIAPDSTFYLLPVAKTEKISTLVTKSDFINALRLIPGVAIVGFASVASDASIGVAVRAAQTLVDNMAAEFIYIDSALIEGVGSYIEGAITGFSDLREFDCENVSVIISQDSDIASQDSAYSTHASIGTALGSLAVRAIHENLGSVDIEVKPRSKRGTADYSLTSQKEERFLSSALSNGIPFNQISASLQKKLTELGYIYAGSFAGYSGVFFSNSCTCCEADSDYAFIERNGIWNAEIGRASCRERVYVLV